MPILLSRPIRPVSQEEFNEIDYQVTGLAFAVHNHLGPFLFDEKIYQRELAWRCTEAGFQAVMEASIEVRFGSFSTTYAIDLLVNECALYELKVVAALSAHHRRQAIDYLALTGLHHAKLINFFPESVEKEFVSSNLTWEKRANFTIHDHLLSTAEESRWLRRHVGAMLDEWGAFLETQLYYDAIVHFRGGKEAVVQLIEIHQNGRVLGRQHAHLLTPKAAFRITAHTEDQDSYRKHLQRFLSHTFLDCVHWINLNRHHITFATVSRV